MAERPVIPSKAAAEDLFEQFKRYLAYHEVPLTDSFAGDIIELWTRLLDERRRYHFLKERYAASDFSFPGGSTFDLDRYIDQAMGLDH
jgi:hypothetical protein